MDPGKRDERVAIYQDTGTTLDDAGQHIPAWSSVGSRWAEVKGRDGQALFRTDQSQSQTTHVVTVTADSLTRTIEPYSFYFLWRSRILRPLPGVQPFYRDLEISFECEEVVSGV